MDIKLEDLQVKETMSIGDLGMAVTSVGGSSIQFEEYPVDSGYLKYNADTGLYSTEEIDLSGKVDKTNEPLKVYGTDSQGNQVEWIFRNTNNTKNTVAGRDSNGNIQVGTAVNSTDAVNKQYVDGNFVKSTSEARKIYGTDENGSSAEYNLVSNTYTANTIVQRSATGTIATADPQWGNDATNKRYVDDRFNGASKVISYDTYADMITALNGMSAGDLKQGQDIFIVQTGIPDVWVAYVEDASVPYTYVDDDTFVNELLASGTVQVGYYKLGYLETQKADLTNYATVSQVNSKVQKVTYSQDNTLPTGSDYGYYGRAYLRDWSNKDNSVPVTSQAFNFTLPIRDANGNFYVADPTQPYHCANVRYITALEGTQAPTESTVAKFVGQFYYDVTNNKTYQCTARDTTNKVYTWVQIIRSTDYAGNSIKGVVDVRAAFGMMTDQYGRIQIVKATEDEIKAKANEYHPIVPSNLDYAIVQGLTNNANTLTDEQKSEVQTWLGLDSLSADTKDINTSEFAKEFAAGASETDISSVYAWDKITAPAEFTQRQRACVYGNGYYVIAGIGGQGVYSKDGVNWFMLPSFTTGIITGLAYGNGYFLAVDSNGGIYRTDIPLNTWTNVYTFTGVIQSIRYINNTFVAVGENGFIGVSSDGKTWNEKQSGTTSNIIDITYGDGKYVAVGAAGTVLTSINAEIWYPQTIEGHTTDIRTVCYANGMFVMGASGGRIDYSENGETWSQANNPSANTISWVRAFSYSNNRLYTVMYTSSGAGEIWLSKDKGASWEVAQTTAGRLWCVTFGEDKFITSGDNGAIYVLDLNVEWSNTPIDAEYKWYRFKTTQNNGNIIYSDAYYDSSASLEAVKTMVGDLNTALESILGV